MKHRIPLGIKRLTAQHVNVLPNGIVHIGVLGESGMDINPDYIVPNSCRWQCGADCLPMRVKITFGSATTDACEPCAPQKATVNLVIDRTNYGDYTRRSQDFLNRMYIFTANLGAFTSTNVAPGSEIARQFLEWVAEGNYDQVNASVRFPFTASLHPADPNSVYVYMRVEEGYSVPCETFKVSTSGMVGAITTIVNPGFQPIFTKELVLSELLHHDVTMLQGIDYTVNDGYIERCEEYCVFEFTLCYPAGCGPDSIPNSGNTLDSTVGSSKTFYSYVRKGSIDPFITALQTALKTLCSDVTEIPLFGNTVSANFDHTGNLLLGITSILYDNAVYNVSPVTIGTANITTSQYVSKLAMLQAELISLTGNQDIVVEGNQPNNEVNIYIGGVTSLVTFFLGSTAVIPNTKTNALGVTCSPTANATKPLTNGAVATIIGLGNVPANVTVEIDATNLAVVPTFTVAPNGANLSLTFSTAYTSPASWVILAITDKSTGCTYRKKV